MASFIVKPTCQLSDVPAMVEIEQECFERRIAWDAATYLKHLPKWWTWKAVDSWTEELQGFIGVEPHRRYGYIYTLNVGKNFRRHGVAWYLMEWAESFVRSTKRKRMELHVAIYNSDALRFYLKHGYRAVKVEHDFYYEGSDALKMEKKL